jgi:hypothetical protein
MMKFGLGLLLASFNFILVAGVDAQEVRGAVPEAADYLPPVNPLPNWYEVRGGEWEVPVEVLAEIAILTGRQLGPGRSIMSSPAYGYTMQYQGRLHGNDRTVKLMGACQVNGWTPAMLSHRFMVVSDGGKCYFSATYDIETKDFAYFAYNAVR